MIDPVRLFDSFCDKRPDSPSVVESNQTISYISLQLISHQIASILSKSSETPRVAIYLPRCGLAYASMFGTLRSGGYYTPMNTSAPRKRNELILKAFEPEFILTTRELAAEITDAFEGCKTIYVEELSGKNSSRNKPGHLAYVIFTSGTTGVPKGVVISRSALSHYISWAQEAFGVTEADRWSQHPNIGFDLSVLDIFGALCSGATLYPMSGAKSDLMPATFIRDNDITIWNSVPSVIDLMLRAKQLTPKHVSTVRLFNFCGEPLLERHLEGIFKANPETIVQNTYGPTEATVSCSSIRIDRHNFKAACSKTVAIGQAIENTTFYIDDGIDIKPSTEDNNEGELLISSTQLAEGYWKDTNRTEQSFCNVKVGDQTVRVYRTGDVVEVSEGQTFFRTRLDEQIKIRGYRLELDEIDSFLIGLGLGLSCTVYVDDNLFSFIETNSEISEIEIKKQLSDMLPDYAVPKAIKAIEMLPRNNNDKLDRGSLRDFVRERYID